MKKILLIVSSTLLLANNFLAQDTDDDKKFRLGLKVAAQPTWFSSNESATTKGGAGFGFGFGLVTEFRLGKTASFVTGIGGDFESGSVRYKFDPLSSTPHSVGYITDNAGNLKELKDGVNQADLIQTGDVLYAGVTERKIKTTHVTIPIALKMMTKEMGGFKYFGMFGGEIGIRVKSRATDKYTSSFTSTSYNLSSGTNTNININKDGSLIPLRVGMNVGLGAEYRLSGSTSMFLSINYFRSFTNLMRKESAYMVYDSKIYSDGTMTFFRVKQGIFMNAIRINVGILF
ncbi:MAG: outer membrane beta-barrel protein [Burkholderiales bacterium]|nr:outer membrane beta-barrel protein [Bacteroidia bacterium]